MALLGFCSMLGCGSTAHSPNEPIDAGPEQTAIDAPPGTSPPDAPPSSVGTLVTLVDNQWTLAPRSEAYRCVRKTVTADMVIDRFEPINPLGTHHTVVTVGSGGLPDGEFDCSSTVASPQTIYVSGVNTPAMDLPPGVGMRVKKGDQLLLNLHLFNTSSSPLSGRSGVKVRLAEPQTITHEAEAVLAGTLSLDIQPGTSVQTGYCTLGPTTIFAIAPHMHQLGIYQKVTVEGSGQILLDREYSFDAQTFDLLDHPMPSGGRLRVDCTYANPGNDPVGWGESSEKEMCFAIVYRYPALGRFQICTN